MLLVVAVFDGFFDAAKAVEERRGWFALGAALWKTNGRALKMWRAILIAIAIAACAIAWPSSQLLWCALPPVVALLM